MLVKHSVAGVSSCGELIFCSSFWNGSCKCPALLISKPYAYSYASDNICESQYSNHVFFVKVYFILSGIYRSHEHRLQAVWLCLHISTGHLNDSTVYSTFWYKIEPEKWRMSMPYSSLAELMLCIQGIWGIGTPDHAPLAGVKENQNVIVGRNQEGRVHAARCW